MPYAKKGNTKLTVDQILDGAADILQASGWVTGVCHDSETGGHCAIGALAQAVYPRANSREVEVLAYVGQEDDRYGELTGRSKDPRLVEAVSFLAERVNPDHDFSYVHNVITDWNDALPNGEGEEFDPVKREYVARVDKKVRLASSRKVVAQLRNAAKAYRRQQAKAAA